MLPASSEQVAACHDMCRLRRSEFGVQTRNDSLSSMPKRLAFWVFDSPQLVAAPAAKSARANVVLFEFMRMPSSLHARSLSVNAT